MLIICERHQTHCDDFYFHFFTACFASAKAPIPGERLNMTFTTQTLCSVCAALFLSLRAVISAGKGNVKPAVKRSVIWRTFKKTLVLCAFVFLCIKHLNFSSSTVSLLFPRRGMHGSEESIHTGTNCFLTASQISTQPISYLSSLPPVIRPSAQEDKFQHFIR